jgi:hypothetical protein
VILVETDSRKNINEVRTVVARHSYGYEFVRLDGTKSYLTMKAGMTFDHNPQSHEVLIKFAVDEHGWGCWILYRLET